eukprot:COSAG05_NODE_24235_length_253_cov_0.506494_1_plen_50_part_01
MQVTVVLFVTEVGPFAQTRFIQIVVGVPFDRCCHPTIHSSLGHFGRGHSA